MGRPSDRDPSYMREAHGTTRLITDYASWPDSAGKSGSPRLSSQNRTMDLAREGISEYKEALDQLGDPSSIRNADDYDDWEYGTEPIPHDHTWTRRRSS